MTTANRPPPLDAFREDRTYLGADHLRNERRTWLVAGIYALTLVVLLTGGVLTGSMALTAAGLHMAAHVAVLLAAAAAYAMARRHASNPAFSFGTGKLGYLAGFANAVVLAITAVLIAVESIGRILDPQAVDYHSAIPIAAAGLAINLVCIWLLRPTGAQHELHDRHGDLSLSAAHLHLSADAVVLVLALAAVLAGGELGWTIADPLAGLLSAGLVAQFAVSLIRRAGANLLDINPSAELTAEVRKRLSSDGERVIDLHLWRLGPGHHAVIAVIAADPPRPVDTYRSRLADLAGVSHVTVEVHGPGEDSHHHHD